MANQHSGKHRAMGTEFTVHLGVAGDPQACLQAVFDEIDRIEEVFSRFRESSEISRINRHACDGPVVTDPEVFRMLAAAREVSERTQGAFDITVGSLTRAWRSAAKLEKIPDAQTLVDTAKSVGWANMELDPLWRTVQFFKPGMEIDCGAIAKGYAVDRAIEILRAANVQGWIDAGSSSIAATDEAFARDWKVCVVDPLNSSNFLSEVLLGGRALSTSGVKEQSFEAEGRLYSHLIDPVADRQQADQLQRMQATVLAPTSMLADALSTAIFILGYERGSVVLRQFADCSALWIYQKDNQTFWRAHLWPTEINSPIQGSIHGQA
jgi:thiamine biosynthesis lipoprotein